MSQKTTHPILTWAQITRIPNVFTAIADVAMGFLFVNASLHHLTPLVLLIVTTSLLYSAGMVLNDVFDLEQDTRERPHRPIPSGRVRLATANRVGWGLLIGGVIAGSLVGAAWGTNDPFWWRSGLIALLLASCVVLYDGLLKPTALGPIAMGACRFFNVLLGMSVGSMSTSGAGQVLGYDPSQWIVASGIGIYVAGITIFAKTEAQESGRGRLVCGLLAMLAGLVLLASFPRFGVFARGRALTFSNAAVWPLLIAVLGFSVARRCLLAIGSPQPQLIQVAVKQSIMSLIIFNAAICLAVRPPFYWAVAIIALIVPMLLLGKWVYST